MDGAKERITAWVERAGGPKHLVLLSVVDSKEQKDLATATAVDIMQST